jgi:hypothetical protein
MYKTRYFITLFVAVIFILSACNLPSNAPATEEPNAISTNAALTVQALLNQSTPFNTPTLPPAPATNTAVSVPSTSTTIPPTTAPLASATPVCDQAQFISETIPDGTNFNAGDTFTKVWRVKNIGNCTWTGYALVFDNGEAMSGVSPIAIANVAPGQEVDLTVNLKAPASSGAYRGYWRIRNASGVLIPVQGGYQSKSFFVDINVGGSSGGPFAVTSVAMSVSGLCGNFTITANITANGAGNVTYKWVRSDGAIDGAVHPPIVFAAAGSQSVNTTWSVAAAGSYWMDIYIDSPNHQQFGRANFSCP